MKIRVALVRFLGIGVLIVGLHRLAQEPLGPYAGWWALLFSAGAAVLIGLELRGPRDRSVEDRARHYALLEYLSRDVAGIRGKLDVVSSLLEDRPAPPTIHVDVAAPNVEVPVTMPAPTVVFVPQPEPTREPTREPVRLVAPPIPPTPAPQVQRPAIHGPPIQEQPFVAGQTSGYTPTLTPVTPPASPEAPEAPEAPSPGYRTLRQSLFGLTAPEFAHDADEACDDTRDGSYDDPGPRADEEDDGPPRPSHAVYDDLLSALVNLGWRRHQAESMTLKALAAATTPGSRSIPELVRWCLLNKTKA